MDNQIKARVARKLIRRTSQDFDEQMGMDLAMDGSGELSGVIYEHYEHFWEKRVEGILSILGLSKEYYEEYLRCAMQIEGHYVNAFNSCPDAYYDFCMLGR